jgi:hypothetical protein
MQAQVRIQVLEAVTQVNSKSQKSRIEGMVFHIGDVVFPREDGLFYENILIEGKEFRPFYEFASQEFTLDCVVNRLSKTITIKKFILV